MLPTPPSTGPRDPPPSTSHTPSSHCEVQTQQLGWGLQEAPSPGTQAPSPGTQAPKDSAWSINSWEGLLEHPGGGFWGETLHIHASVSLIVSSTSMVLTVLKRYGWSLVPPRNEFNHSLRAFLYLLV